MNGLLGLGMSWELALEARSWAGTRDELLALARRVAILRAEMGAGGGAGARQGD